MSYQTRDSRNAWQKKYRAQHVEQGMCLKCREKSIKGYKVCQFHLDKQRNESAKRNNARREAGICQRCGRNTVQYGYSHCFSCLYANRRFSRKVAIKRSIAREEARKLHLEKYATLKEVSEALNVPIPDLRALCKYHIIEGVYRWGERWFIERNKIEPLAYHLKTMMEVE